MKEVVFLDARPIGVFDSGLGGLTTVKKMAELLPGEDVIYLGDTGRVPYGSRSRETIVKYAREDMAFLRRFDIKAVVVACGTVSTNALDEISGDYDIPVMGVVSAAAAAAVRATKSGRIGLIGTKASVRSGAYDRKIRELLPAAEITKNACPLFVPLVESGRLDPDDVVLRTLAEEYLAPVRAADVDTLILGCTHYPLIEGVIARVMGPGVTLVSPGAETTRELAAYLAENDLLREDGPGTDRYFVTDSAEDFASVASLFLGGSVRGSVERVSLDE